MIVYYFLIFILPLSRHRIWGAMTGDITGIKYIGAICLPYAIFHLSRRRTMPAFLASWQVRFFLLLYLMVTVSYLLFSHMVIYFSHWLTYTSFIMFLFITMVVVDSLPRVRWSVLSGIGSIGLASAYVVRDWQLYHNISYDYRPGYVVGDPNYFTVDALLFLPVALLLLQQRKPRWQWWFCLGCLAMTLAAVLFSASRGGFIGLVAACLYFLARSRQRIRNLILAVLAIGVLSLPMNISPVGRLLHPTQSDEFAKEIRLVVWSGGLELVEQHPIFGVGLDNFRMEVGKHVDLSKVPVGETVQRVAHNSYLEIAAELGLPALLLFLGIIIGSIFSLEQSRRAALASGDEFLQRVTMGLQAGLIGAGVALFFVSGEYQKMFWLTVFISAALPAMARSEQPAAAVAASARPYGYAGAPKQQPALAGLAAGKSSGAARNEKKKGAPALPGGARWQPSRFTNR